MRTRIIGSAALIVAVVSLSVSIGTRVSGQERPVPMSRPATQQALYLDEKAFAARQLELGT